RPLALSGLRLPLILQQNLKCVIQGDPARSRDLPQYPGTGSHTARAHSLVLPVCHQDHVGVDDEGHSADRALWRLAAATVLAVRSSISFPKKFSGQFPMSPSSFSRSGSSSALRVPPFLQKW